MAKTKTSKPLSETATIDITQGTASVEGETLAEAIQRTRALANSTLDEVPQRLLGAFSIARGNARDALVEMEADFARFLKDNSVLAFLEGPTAALDAFEVEAMERGPVVFIDVNRMYQIVVDELEPSLAVNRREFGTQQYLRLLSTWNMFAEQLKAEAAPPENLFTFVQQEQTLPFVRNVIESTNPPEGVFALWVAKQVFDQALSVPFAKIIPIVIVSASDAQKALLKKNLLDDDKRTCDVVVTGAENEVLSIFNKMTALRP